MEITWNGNYELVTTVNVLSQLISVCNCGIDEMLSLLGTPLCVRVDFKLIWKRVSSICECMKQTGTHRLPVLLNSQVDHQK